MTDIDKYLEKIETSKKEQLERIRNIALHIVPDAKQVISYGMPTLQYQGQSFLGFDAHKNHIGIYPYGGEETEVFKDRILELGYQFSSGAIRVPFDKPIPEDFLKEIVQHRMNRLRSKR